MTPEQLMGALSAPFEATEVKFKPAVVTGNRALALPYVDARVIMDRLDDVLGVGGWQDEYEVIPDGSVVCRLRVRIGDEWLCKMDVGSKSEQPDEGDQMKAAFSDALKRAAVKYGVGRYLYRLPSVWCDWDAQKKRFAKDPQLPASALPGHKPPAKVAAPANGDKVKVPSLPADATEFQKRVCDYDAKLAGEGFCAPGELVKAVIAAGKAKGYSDDLGSWPTAGFPLAARATKDFEVACRAAANEAAA